MPQAAIAQSIAIASMPTLSAQAALNKMDEFRNTLASSLRGMLLLSIPASIGLMILRRPIVALLYQRGEFNAQSTDLVAWPLLWFAAGLVGHSVVELLSRAFYAMHDTRTPVAIGAVAMSLNVIFSLTFSILFTWLGWMPHGGLALANSLATSLEMAGLLFLLRKRLSRLEGTRILQMTWQSLLGGGVMAIFLWGWLAITKGQPFWMQVFGGVSIGGGLYLLSIWLLKVPELFSFAASVKRRITRSVAR
jgi:putative peptidoglycan lipid II flippase